MLPPATIVPADQDLHYSVILPSLEEWAQLFPSNSSSNSGSSGSSSAQPSTPPPYSAVHLWLKCVGATLRGYLFVDAVADVVDVSLSREREQALVRAFDKRVLVDGVPVELSMSMAGAEFFAHLGHGDARRHTYGEVHVTVRGWRRYAKFPLHACAAAPLPLPAASNRRRPDYIFHSYTMESSFRNAGAGTDADADTMLPAMAQVRKKLPCETASLRFLTIRHRAQAVAKHLAYHLCLFGNQTAAYYIATERAHIPLYLNHSVIAEHAREGRVVFSTRENNIPAPVLGKTFKWQIVFQNLFILQHYMHPRHPNVRLFFFDADEYVHVRPSMAATLHDTLRRHDVVNFQRKDTVCIDSACQGRPEHGLPIRGHAFQQSDRHLPAKVVLNPNMAGCLLVHFSLCRNNRTAFTRLNSHVAYLVHFGNTLSARVRTTEASFNGYAADLDAMHRCLPPPGSTSFEAGTGTGMDTDAVMDFLAAPTDAIEDFVTVTAYDFVQTHGPGVTAAVGIAVVACVVLLAATIRRLAQRCCTSRTRQTI